MNVRAARHDDIPAVEDCAEAAYQVYVAAIGRKPAPMVADFAASHSAGHLFVAEDDDGIGGFIVFYPRGDHVHLENIAVAPGRQGQGVGSKLIAYAEHSTLTAGYDRIELYTNEKMTGNLTWYPRLGYRETGRRT